jgi:hypothetical protein
MIIESTKGPNFYGSIHQKVEGDGERIEASSPKIEALCEQLFELREEGHSVLVFSPVHQLSRPGRAGPGGAGSSLSTPGSGGAGVRGAPGSGLALPSANSDGRHQAPTARPRWGHSR